MSDNTDRFRHLEYLPVVLEYDNDYLQKKDRSYGASWKKRGGTGAFMMLARKWDRLEELIQTISKSWDILGAVEAERGTRQGTDGTVIAEVRDLRRYLALVEAEAIAAGSVDAPQRSLPSVSVAVSIEKSDRLLANMRRAIEDVGYVVLVHSRDDSVELRRGLSPAQQIMRRDLGTNTDESGRVLSATGGGPGAAPPAPEPAPERLGGRADPSDGGAATLLAPALAEAPAGSWNPGDSVSWSIPGQAAQHGRIVKLSDHDDSTWLVEKGNGPMSVRTWVHQRLFLYTPEHQRQPLRVTSSEHQAIEDQVIPAGSMAGLTWSELYTTLPDGQEPHAAEMIEQYREEYAR